MSPYVPLAVAIAFEVAATFLLRASHGIERWPYAVASAACYLVAGVLLSYVLERVQVGITYAIWAGSGIALICLTSVVLFGQRFDPPAIAGILLIVSGVALITLRSSVVL